MPGLRLLAALALSVALPLEAAVLKIATIAPEGSRWMNEMRAGAKEIAERTEGRVSLKFYGGGVMGSDSKVMRKIRIGQLQGGAVIAGALAERYSELLIYGLPLVFSSPEEVDFVRERMDETLLTGLEEAGFVSFGITSLGFAMLMSKTPVRTLDDLKGRKVWTPEGDPVAYAAMETLGLSPVTLPVTDVLTGLQTGLIDIITASPVGALVLQWHTKLKYVTDYPLAYLYGFLVIEKAAFYKLEKRDQAVVRDVMTRIYADFDRENRADNEEAAEALMASGLEFVSLSSGEVEQWRTLLAVQNRKLADDGLYPPALLDEMEALLAKFRSGTSTQPDG